MLLVVLLVLEWLGANLQVEMFVVLVFFLELVAEFFVALSEELVHSLFLHS